MKSMRKCLYLACIAIVCAMNVQAKIGQNCSKSLHDYVEAIAADGAVIPGGADKNCLALGRVSDALKAKLRQLEKEGYPHIFHLINRMADFAKADHEERRGYAFKPMSYTDATLLNEPEINAITFRDLQMLLRMTFLMEDGAHSTPEAYQAQIKYINTRFMEQSEDYKNKVTGKRDDPESRRPSINAQATSPRRPTGLETPTEGHVGASAIQESPQAGDRPAERKGPLPPPAVHNALMAAIHQPPKPLQKAEAPPPAAETSPGRDAVLAEIRQPRQLRHVDSKAAQTPPPPPETLSPREKTLAAIREGANLRHVDNHEGNRDSHAAHPLASNSMLDRVRAANAHKEEERAKKKDRYEALLKKKHNGTISVPEGAELQQLSLTKGEWDNTDDDWDDDDDSATHHDSSQAAERKGPPPPPVLGHHAAERKGPPPPPVLGHHAAERKGPPPPPVLGHHAAERKGPPPPTVAPKTHEGSPTSAKRGALLAGIQNFNKGGLKKAETHDRSGPQTGKTTSSDAAPAQTGRGDLLAAIRQRPKLRSAEERAAQEAKVDAVTPPPAHKGPPNAADLQAQLRAMKARKAAADTEAPQPKPAAEEKPRDMMSELRARQAQKQRGAAGRETSHHTQTSYKEIKSLDFATAPANEVVQTLETLKENLDTAQRAKDTEKADTFKAEAEKAVHAVEERLKLTSGPHKIGIVHKVKVKRFVKEIEPLLKK